MSHAFSDYDLWKLATPPEYDEPEERPERDPDADMEAAREDREFFRDQHDEPTGHYDFFCYLCRAVHSTSVRHE